MKLGPKVQSKEESLVSKSSGNEQLRLPSINQSQVPPAGLGFDNKTRRGSIVNL